MRRLIRLEQAVIVEGKYDKITLENVVDALIIPTDGFSVFKDEGKRALIKHLAYDKGIIVMTDSDSAGALIRAHIKSIASGGKIINVYIPCLKGKERRKTKQSKEGLLGVEGMKPEVILSALNRSGVTCQSSDEPRRRITKTDLFEFGLSGTKGSAERRKKLLKEISLPEKLSPNAMLDILNTFYSYEEFKNLVSDKKKKQPLQKK